MAITVADFRAFLPAFAKTPADYIQLHLDASAIRITEDVYGSMRQEALFYDAAHRMSLDPSSQGARLSQKDTSGATVYSVHLTRIQRIVGAWCITA